VVTPGRWTKLGTAERGTQVRVLARSRGLASRVTGGTLRVRLTGAERGTLRYRLVVAGGKPSRVVTVSVRS